MGYLLWSLLLLGMCLINRKENAEPIPYSFRELAFQISEQFAVLGSTMNIQTSVVVGGMDMMAQAIELRARPHVVIATPGRLVDLMNSGSGEWDLSRVKFLVRGLIVTLLGITDVRYYRFSMKQIVCFPAPLLPI